ncbi:MAG: signal peptidase I [Armatimonadetes bacterium]|nr:signal peptidase I [Armatimonadota bacterium]
MRAITERLANLSTIQVIIIVVILAAIRFLLPRFWKQPAAKSIAEIAESLAVAMALVFLLIRPFLVQSFYIPSLSMYPTLLENDQILVNKLVYRIREPKLHEVVVFKAPYWADTKMMRQAEAEADLKGLQGKARAQYIKNACLPEKDYIKRVIGVPGDIVYITKAYVLIDNAEYNREGLKTLLPASGGITSVKLLKDGVLVDDHKITIPEIAAAIGNPKTKIKIFPGTVYINGRPLKEPYTAEDPDLPYPNLDGREDQRTPERDLKYVVEYKGHKAIKIPPGKLLMMGDNRNNSHDARFWGLLDRDRVLGKAMCIFWPLNRIRIVR